MLRSTLLLTTGLIASGLALAGARRAVAQAPMPINTLPTGMAPVAGNVAVSVNGATMTVTQASRRAAIDWHSFDIGAAATVRFQDPTPQSVTLNRVTGPASTTIAGRLSSNGEVVLINQSGVVFTPTAVVDAQSLVVSATGITQDGMRRGVATGRFVLDQAPHPGARVTNAGHMSLRQGGLAALVAPQVANQGTISAPFGTVTLAGSTAQVVDLYGDGLLSLDVTRQTITGAAGEAALVTNDGLIAAQGGRVLLTTAAIDGMIGNLVTAGGTITTSAAGGEAGRVLIDAAGGTATVTGVISARGDNAVSGRGGTVAVQASEVVTLARGSLVDASGARRGGTVAVGTTLARARANPFAPGADAPGTVARRVNIADTAVVRADATQRGQGGRITVLSTDATGVAGRLSARGGARGGNGGIVEVSGHGGLGLVGVIDTAAPAGRAGGLVIDPGNLTVASGGGATLDATGTLNIGAATADATIDPGTIQAGAGDIALIASNLLTVTDAIDLTGTSNAVTSLLLRGDGGVTINRAITANTGSVSFFTSTAGTIAVNALVTAPALAFDGGGSVTVGALVTATSVLGLGNLASFATAGNGSVTTPLLTQLAAGNTVGGALSLANTRVGGNPGNTINAIGPLSVGQLTLVNQTNLAIAGQLTSSGSVSFNTAGASTITVNAPVTATALAFDGGGSITVGALVTASSVLGLGNLATFATTGNGAVSTPLLTQLAAGNTVSGALSLALARAGGNPGNTITAIGTLTAGQLTLINQTGLTISGPVASPGGAGVIGIQTPSITIAATGSLTAATVALAPVTGAATLEQTKTGAGFTLAQSDIDRIAATTLRVGRALGATTATSLTVSGAVDAAAEPTLELDTAPGGAIAVNAPLSATSLVLNAGGSVGEAGGTVQATSLGGVVGAGGVTLLGANQIDTVSNLVVSGPLALADATNLTVGAGVSATTALFHVTSAGGLLTLANAVTATGGTLQLQADAITVSAPPTTGSAPLTLIEVAPSTARPVVVGGAAAGALGLDNATLANLPAATLEIGAIGPGIVASDITLNTTGAFGGTSALLLNATGTIGQTTPLALRAGATLSGSAGSVLLDNAANAIGSLGAFTSGPDFNVSDSGTLTVVGRVATTGGTLAITAPTLTVAGVGLVTGGGPLVALHVDALTGAVADTAAGGTIAVTPFTPGATLQIGSIASTGSTLALGDTLTTAGIHFSGASTIGNTIVTLATAAGGTVDEANGTSLSISPGTLTGSAGVIALAATGAVNTLGTLGDLTATTGDLTIAAAGTLAVAGTVGVTAGHVVTLSVPTLATAATGLLSAPSGTIILRTDATTGSLRLDATGGTVAIAPVASGSPEPAFSIATLAAATLELGGVAGTPLASTLRLGALDLSASGLSLVALEATGAISQAGPLILPATAALTAASSGDITLTDAGNTIGTLGRFGSTGGNVSVASATALTVADTASVTSGHTLTVSTPSLIFAGAGQLSGPSAAVVVRADQIATAVTIDATGGTVSIAPLTTGNPEPVFSTGTLLASTLELGGVAGTRIAGTLPLGTLDLATSGLSTLILEATGAISQTGPLVLPGTVTLTGSTNAAATFSDPGNGIALLGNFTADGGFTLVDAIPLVVTGAVGGGATGVSLTDTATGVASAIDVASGAALGGGSVTLAVQATETVLEAADATITTSAAGGGANTLGGTAGTMLLQGTANRIGSIGTLIVAGQLDLHNSQSLLTTATSVLSAGTLTGNVVATGATLTLGLDLGQVSIANLGSLTVGGTLAIVDQTTLTVAGGVVADLLISLRSDGLLYTSGSLGAGIVEIAPRSLIVLDLGTNGVLGDPFVDPLVLANTAATLLRLGAAQGVVAATGIAFNATVAPGSALGNAVAAVDLQATGPVTQPGGALVLPGGTLTGTTGAVAMTAGNAVAVLGDYTVTDGGTFDLANTLDLTVAGRIGGTTLAEIAGIRLDVTGGLTLVGTLAAPTGLVDLSANGATETNGTTTGTINAAALTSTAGASGTFDLGGGVNTIGTLVGWGGTLGSTLRLVDNAALVVADSFTAGPVSRTGPSTASTLLLTAPTLTLQGVLDTTFGTPGSGAVDLTATSATGSVTQTAGQVATGLLTGTAAGVFAVDAVDAFGATQNQIAAIGPITGGPTVSIRDATALAVVGTVSAASRVHLEAPDITVAATVVAENRTGAATAIDLLATGGLAITATGQVLTRNGAPAHAGSLTIGATFVTEDALGVINTQTLVSGTASGTFNLLGQNTIDHLGAFAMADGSTLALRDNVALSVDGPVTLGGDTAAPGVLALLANALTFTGPVNATTIDVSTTLDPATHAGGDVTQVGTASALTATLLTSSFGIAGRVLLGPSTADPLAGAANAVGTIDHVTAASTFTYGQPGTAPITARNIAATQVTILVGGSLTLDGAIAAAGGTVDLSAAGITQAGAASITAAVLTGTRAGSGTYDLVGTNSIATLGTFNPASAGAAETLNLTDTVALTVSGPVTLPAVTLTAPSLTLAGLVSTGSLDLTTTAGGVSQTAGQIAVGTLASTGGIAGAASLTAAANQIAALAQFAATGTVALTTATGLALDGPLSAPAVTLLVSGALTENAGGTVATPLLLAHSAGATLDQPGNRIGILGFDSGAGALVLRNDTALTIGSLRGQGASIATGGAVDFAGAIDEAGAQLAVATANADVTQSAGTITAGSFLANAANVTLAAANAIGALGDTTLSGNLVLRDTAPLTIAGTVQAGTVDLTLAQGLGETGRLVAQVLQSSGGITGGVGLGGANAIAALGPMRVTGGSLLLRNTVALAVGPLTLDPGATVDLSTSAGGITQTGAITAGTLTSSAGIAGDARFDAPGNVIAVLGNLAVVGGDLALADATGLTVAGPLTAANVSLSTGGPLTLAGDILVPGTLALTSANSIRRTGGLLAVDTLTGSAAGSASFNTGTELFGLGATTLGQGVQVQRIDGFTVGDSGEPGGLGAASTLVLADSVGLALSGRIAADFIQITASGVLTWRGTLVTQGAPRQVLEGPTASPADGSWLRVTAGPGGTGTIDQVGNAVVLSQDGLVSTLRLQLPSTGGTIRFANLTARQTDLILKPGVGTITGTIDVGDLLIITPQGAGGSAQLFGSVRNLLGPSAAQVSEVNPFANASYRLNNCVIHSVNCVLLPTATVPQQTPLRDLAIGQARNDDEDIDVLLPNVAEQDY